MPTALVTGASSGIGAQYAVQLAAVGYDIVLVGRDESALREAAGRVTASGRAPEVLVADLTAPTDLERVCERAARDDVTMLVNNAGAGTPGEFATSTAATEQAMLDLNVTAVMRLCHAVLPRMLREDRGAIINVASVAATIAFPGIAVYSATKSAVDRLTRVAAMESGKLGYGVRVNCLYPGLVPTAMGAGLANDVAQLGLFESPDAAVAAVVGLTPAGRLGEVSDMADAVVFLASNEARFITGIGLPVDGGMGM